MSKKITLVRTDSLQDEHEALYINGKLMEFDSHGLLPEHILEALDIPYRAVSISSEEFYEFDEELDEDDIIAVWVDRRTDDCKT